MPLTPTEYQHTQSRVLVLAGMLADLRQLDAMLEGIQRAEAVGPIIDPTLFKRAGANLEDIARIAGALSRARAEILAPHARLREWAAEQLEALAE